MRLDLHKTPITWLLLSHLKPKGQLAWGQSCWGGGLKHTEEPVPLIYRRHDVQILSYPGPPVTPNAMFISFLDESV